ncbi:hypothetical protein EDB83DRAFT_2680386 [Lactarius deliciosus]|nr:hypothetical protein EDB83DRAFT_2680386 [Lactarius deliciosus]
MRSRGGSRDYRMCTIYHYLKIEMARTDEESNRHHVTTVNILPDDILFYICLPNVDLALHMTVWQRLVRVCQRWRRIIYASPRYLDLHLYCSSETPFREDLSLWPDSEFPLIVEYWIMGDEYHLIAALQHTDRVRRVDLLISVSEVADVVEAMEVPFPVPTHLELTGPKKDRRRPKDMLYLPDDFLGGSAPCLQHLYLEAVALADLPTLLLSARDLVSL